MAASCEYGKIWDSTPRKIYFFKVCPVKRGHTFYFSTAFLILKVLKTLGCKGELLSYLSVY